ncbi:hypothetical protein BGZ54_007797 [Gamsiella multidivaricata]|nr:hypothetical protein BGZ54_007797 [Gamsiella multidivaricata]
MIYFDQESGSAEFFVRPAVNVQNPDGMAVWFEVKIYETLNRLLKNFLTRDILNTHYAIAIEIESQLQSNPTSSIISLFWDDPSTADVAIICSPEAKPVFVHKAIVLDEIPKVLDLVTIVKGSASSTLAPVTVTNSNDAKTTAKSNSESKNEKTKGTPPSPPPPTASQPLDAFTVAHPCSRSSSASSASTVGSWTERPSTSSKQNLRSQYAIREDREVWVWPNNLPPHSCLDIMRWIYLRELTPTYSLQDFNPFMDLLEQLGQLHHFQEHALRARVDISIYSKPADLLRCHQLSRGYAAKLLRSEAKVAITKAWVSLTAQWPEDELRQVDRTGIVNEIIMEFTRLL